MNLRYLRDQLVLNFRTLGKTVDVTRCEEPGKATHESPYAFKGPDGYTSEYAATDTTSYMLIGLHSYWKMSGDDAFVKENVDSVIAAYHYIDDHMTGYLLRDDPTDYCANEPRLHAHYFRDGGFWEFPNHKQPYPAYYFNTNALTVAALRGLAELQHEVFGDIPGGLPSSHDLEAMANNTVHALRERFWMEDKGSFRAVVYDSFSATNDVIYLDPIWSCRHLRMDDLGPERWQRMLEALTHLEYEDGYINRELVAGYAELGPDANDLKMLEPSIWPIETAELLALIDREDLREIVAPYRGHIIETCMRTKDALLADAYPLKECIQYGPLRHEAWCEYQLWTVAFYVVVDYIMEKYK